MPVAADRMKGVDIAFFTPRYPGAADVLKGVVGALAFKPTSQTERIAAGTLLPASAKADYYLWFHIDDENARPARELFFHLRYLPRPKSPPPAEASRRREANITAEWLMREVSKLLGDEQPLMHVDVEAELRGRERRQTIVMAPPVRSGRADILELCGAEYRTVTGRSVKRFRWSEQDKGGMLDVWLSYTIRWPGSSYSPWRDEMDRCLKYANELL